MVVQQTGKTFCVCAAKVDHKFVAIAFTYNYTALTSLLPPLQLQQQTKKVQTNYHTNCDKQTEKFLSTLRGGAEIQQREGEGEVQRIRRVVCHSFRHCL